MYSWFRHKYHTDNIKKRRELKKNLICRNNILKIHF